MQAYNKVYFGAVSDRDEAVPILGDKRWAQKAKNAIDT